MSASLELQGVTKAFATAKGPLVVVEDFDLTVKEGEFVCLIGHSGCGKSTVLAMIAGLSSATSGDMFLGGKKLTGPGPDRGVVFQAPCLLPWLSATGNVRIGVDQVQSHLTKFQRREIAHRFLRLVGLGDAVDKMPSELSQGMRQRVGLARAFALNPQMLLLDEPFGMLDSLTRMELQQVLLDLWVQDQKTALMVTHDVDEALFLADRVVMMTNGPRAKVGAVLHVPFPRPRDRHVVLNDHEYYKLREDLIQFLESQSHSDSTAPTQFSARTPSVNGRSKVLA
jgi:nitrate/nitrite transport system ATP-binding protein